MARGRDPGFRVIVSLTDQFTRPINNLNNKIAQSTAKIRGLAAVPGAVFKATGLGAIGSQLGKVGSGFLQLRSAITGLLGPFARLGLLAGGIGLGTFISDAIGAGSELVKLSQTTGASVESLQRLQYAAKQSGVSAESMNGALVRLNRSIVEAMKPAKKKGVNEFAQAFRAAGISAAELRTLKPEEIFLRLSSAIANMSSQTNKAALAQKLLGKTGAELIPVMNEGAWGINALGDELAATGAIMDDATARSAKAFGDTMLKMGQHVRGLAYDILRELLPSMIGAAGGMDEWITANKEWLKTEIIQVVRDLVGIGTAFVNLVKNDIIPAIAALRPAWDAVVAVLGKNNAMLLAFTAVVAPGILAALFAIGKAVLGLVAVLAANPIGAAIIAIAAAGLLIWKYWEPIKGFFVDLWEGVKAAFWAVLGWLEEFARHFSWGVLTGDWWGFRVFMGQLWDSIRDVFTGAIAWLGEFAAAWVPQPILDAWAAVADFFSGVWSRVAAAFQVGADVVGAVARAFLPQPILDAWAGLDEAFAGLVSFDADRLVAGAEAAMTAVAGVLARLPQPILDAWSGLDEAIAGIVTFDADRLVAGAETFVTAISGVLARFVPQPILDAWSGVIDFFASVWEGVSAPFREGVNVVADLARLFVPDDLEAAWRALAGIFGAIWADVGNSFRAGIEVVSALVDELVPQPLITAWGELATFWSGLWDRVTGILESAKNVIGAAIDWIIAKLEPLKAAIAGVTGAVGSIAAIPGAVGGAIASGWQKLTGRGAAPASAGAVAATGPAMLAAEGPKALAGAAQQQVSKSEVQVNFSNVPEGTRIRETRSTGNTDVNLRTEYAGPRGALAGAY
jgi:hypothetical protein